jgi:hypothetical protein
MGRVNGSLSTSLIGFARRADCKANTECQKDGCGFCRGQEPLLRSALVGIASLRVLFGGLTIAASYGPALGLRAALSGIQQTNYGSPFAFIAVGRDHRVFV